MKKDELIAIIAQKKCRSAWENGVKDTALDLLYMTEADEVSLFTRLYGAGEKPETLSYGGCLLIYDSDIAERYCTPSELKRTAHGKRRPNRHESWLDVQGRAIYQARGLIYRTIAENYKPK